MEAIQSSSGRMRIFVDMQSSKKYETKPLRFQSVYLLYWNHKLVKNLEGVDIDRVNLLVWAGEMRKHDHIHAIKEIHDAWDS